MPKVKGLKCGATHNMPCSPNISSPLLLLKAPSHQAPCFCAIFWFKQCGVLPGLCFANELISHDEALHCDFACVLYNCLLNLLGLSHQGACWQCSPIKECFIHDALAFNLMSMNATHVNQYIWFCANHLLWKLKQPTIYNVINPFPWITTISLQSKTRKLLWESSEQVHKKWSQYYKQPQISHFLSWWTVLKACNKSHLATYFSPFIYLSMLPKLALEVSYMVLPYLVIVTARRYLYVIQAL